MRSLKTALTAILDTAKDAKSSDAEADLILFHVLREEHPEITKPSHVQILNPTCSPEMEAEAIRIAYARADGQPLQHLLGHQFFFEHEYVVNDSTLIPRPETEILVDAAVRFIEKRHGEDAFTFAELGLGSGVIAGEILARFKNAKAFASEVNPLAIALAIQNLAKILKLPEEDIETRIHIHEPANESTGFETFLAKAPYDLVLSNPPYLSVNDEIELDVIKYEPHLALFPKALGEKENPNFFYENFLTHSKKLLKTDGVALFEVPHERAEAILQLFINAKFTRAHLIPDLTGRSRVLQAGF
jgi:release factor glutamine methyltransferase